MTQTVTSSSYSSPSARDVDAPHKNLRITAVSTTAALLALVALIGAIMVGSSNLTVLDVVKALVGQGESGSSFIVLELRLPRALAAVLVGLSLGMAGALTQTFSRNPLATPDIIGVTSGAALAAVAVIALGGGSYAVSSALAAVGVPVAAVVGGLLTAGLVYGLSWHSGVDSYRLILTGIGITAALTGATNYLIAKADLGIAAAATQWLVGSLSGVSWTSVWPLIAALVVVTPIALSQGSALNVSLLGDEISTGLGVPLRRHKLIVLACAVILTAVSVSAVGPVGFVAFVAPQIARSLTRASRPPLIASACVGALIVSIADIIGRVVLPWIVPVGIITSLIGAPYLMWLLVRRPSKER